MVYARFYESAYAVITSVYAATRTCYTRRGGTDRSVERIEAGKCRSPLLTGDIGARRAYKERPYINLRLWDLCVI